MDSREAEMSTPKKPITRFRLSLSCLPCKRRKVKCDRQHPQCSNCLKMGQICEYESEETSRENQMKRKRDGVSSSEMELEDDSRYSQTQAFGSSSSQGGDVHHDYDRATLRANTTAYSGNSYDGMSGGDFSATVNNSYGYHSNTAKNGNDSQMEDGFSDPSPLNNEASKGPSRNAARGFLTSKTFSQTRFVGPSFWAYIRGHEPWCSDFLTEKYLDHPDLNFPHIDVTGLLKQLYNLPPRITADALVKSFFTNVNSLMPLVHQPWFQKEYENAWNLWGNALGPENDFMSMDPNFLSLLFAVFYAGALTAQPEMWKQNIWPPHVIMNEVQLKTFKDGMSSAYHATLKACRASVHPSMITLIAMVIGQSIIPPDQEPLANLGMVSMMMRMAQSLGCHVRGENYAVGPFRSELRRRVWLQILSLDFQFSISAGSHGSSAGCSGVDYDDRLPTELRDEFLCIADMDPNVDYGAANQPNEQTSTSMLLFRGRFLAERISGKYIHFLQSSMVFTQALFDQYLTSFKMVQAELDGIKKRIPATGFPEKGFVPSKLSKATPITHPSLYEDRMDEPTVLGCWARILLQIIKLEMTVLMAKQHLGSCVDKDLREELWAGACCVASSHLRLFHRTTQMPAFSTYRWAYWDRFPPLQSMFVVLAALERNSTLLSADKRGVALYIVDEVLDFYVPEQGQGNGIDGEEKTTRMEWLMLRDMRSGLPDEHKPAEPAMPLHVPEDESNLDLRELVDWVKDMAAGMTD